MGVGITVLYEVSQAWKDKFYMIILMWNLKFGYQRLRLSKWVEMGAGKNGCLLTVKWKYRKFRYTSIQYNKYI